MGARTPLIEAVEGVHSYLVGSIVHLVREDGRVGSEPCTTPTTGCIGEALPATSRIMNIERIKCTASVRGPSGKSTKGSSVTKSLQLRSDLLLHAEEWSRGPDI